MKAAPPAGPRVATVPTPARVAQIADGLRARRAELAARGASDIIAALGAAGARFLDPGDALRAEALARLPAESGLSRPMCEVVLDGMAADWTAERLAALVAAELGDEAPLDRFVSVRGRHAMAVGPTLAVQVVAGGVPGVGVSALLRSLLVKGPTLLKPGAGDVVLPELYARSLADVDPTLAEALAVVYWPGGKTDLEDAALARADVAVVYGTDETVSVLRARLPATTRLVAYHHRISVGLVGREALSTVDIQSTASRVAEAVALFDQRGCVSPRIVFVEDGGERSPSVFAESLAAALAAVESRWPSGPLDVAQASALQQARGTAEMAAAGAGRDVRHGRTAPWTVVCEGAEGAPGPSAGRFVRVRAIADAGELPALLAPLAPHLQTVGVAGLGERVEGLARALGPVGVSRVAPFAAVAFPPPWWHHDGRGPLLDLVRWVDLES